MFSYSLDLYTIDFSQVRQKITSFAKHSFMVENSEIICVLVLNFLACYECITVREKP